MFATLLKTPQIAQASARRMSAMVKQSKYVGNTMIETGHFAIQFSENDQKKLSKLGYMKPMMAGNGFLEKGEKSVDHKPNFRQNNVHLGGLEIPVEIHMPLRALKTVEPAGKSYHHEIAFGELTELGAKYTVEFEKYLKKRGTHYAVFKTSGTWDLKDKVTGENKVVPTVNCVGLAIKYLEFLTGDNIQLEETATPDRAWEVLLQGLPRIQRLLIDEGVITNPDASAHSSPDCQP